MLQKILSWYDNIYIINLDKNIIYGGKVNDRESL